MLLFLTGVMSEKSWLRGAWARRVLLLLTFLDLWVLGRHRLVDVAPWKPLTAQSPVLASLAGEPRGTRIADRRLRNLPMRVGLAPISAYRTLDLPAAGSLTALALGPLNDQRFEAEVLAALRASGTGVRLIDPVENREDQVLRRLKSDRETIDDPLLAGALFDAAWVTEQGPWARTFSIWRPETPPARAWFVPRSDVKEGAIVDDWSGDPRHIIRVLRNAVPLAAESRIPEEWTILIEATEPGWVVVTQLGDPQWKARWITREDAGNTNPEIRPAFRRGIEPTGWQCVEIPAAGRWTLGLEYDAADAATGLVFSAIAWIGWLIAVFRTAFVRWREPASPPNERMEG